VKELTDLILVRHGQTDGNVARRWQGWSDYPLNAVGLRQAEQVAVRLADQKAHIQAIYSSPLRRAYETAKPISAALGLPVRLLEKLKEFHFGQIEGLTTPEFRTVFPEAYARFQNRADMSFRYPGGESREEFFHRVGIAADSIMACHPGQTVVVVAHGGTLRALLAHFFPEQDATWQTFSAEHCSLTRLSLNGHGPQLLSLDDHTHLEDPNKVEI
jgi:2,3-bisphosphoglycerate-dependent phosphoglycerate mutase